MQSRPSFLCPDHAAAEAFLTETALDADHGDLDDVCRMLILLPRSRIFTGCLVRGLRACLHDACKPPCMPHAREGVSLGAGRASPSVRGRCFPRCREGVSPSAGYDFSRAIAPFPNLGKWIAYVELMLYGSQKVQRSMAWTSVRLGPSTASRPDPTVFPVKR